MPANIKTFGLPPKNIFLTIFKMASFPFILSFLILLPLLLKPNSALSKEENKLVKKGEEAGGGGGVNATVRREVQSFAKNLMNIFNNETSTEEQVKENGQIGEKVAENNSLVDAENEGAVSSPHQNKTRNRRQYYGYYNPYGYYGYGYGGGYGYGYGGYGYGYGGYGGYGYGYGRTICGILGCWRIRFG